jgi:sugar/nucleoside kinase (ribokinase family)
VSCLSVLIVGSIAFDSVETPRGIVEDELGGSAIYGSLACQFHLRGYSKGKTQIVGVVGEDFDVQHQEMLMSKGICTDGIEISPGDTFRWQGKYEGEMDEAITLQTDLNVFEHFSPKIPPHYTDSKIVFCANLHPLIQSTVLDQITSCRLKILDSMNLWISIARDELIAVMKRVDLIIINEGEIAQLTNQTDIPAAIDALKAEVGDKIFVIKKGSKGSVALVDGVMIELPSHVPIDAVDPTGCGDSFAGTLAAHLVKGEGEVTSQELKDAMMHATVTASMNLSTFGTNALQQLTKEQYENQCSIFSERLNH